MFKIPTEYHQKNVLYDFDCVKEIIDSKNSCSNDYPSIEWRSDPGIRPNRIIYTMIPNKSVSFTIEPENKVHFKELKEGIRHLNFCKDIEDFKKCREAS